MGLVGLAACAAPRRLPPPLAPVTPAVPSPPAVDPRPLRLGVLPVLDARLPGEPADKEGRYLYRDRQYRGTRLEALGSDALTQLGQRWAARLAGSGRFERVVFATRPEDAPEVRLWLRLRLVRLRGYVEARPAPGQAPRVLGEAQWGAVVQGPGGRWLDAELGWAVDEPRAGAGDPWAVLVEGLDATYQQLQAALTAMGPGPLPARVRLPPLLAAGLSPSSAAGVAPSSAAGLSPSSAAGLSPSSAAGGSAGPVGQHLPAHTPGRSGAPAANPAAALVAPPGWRLHRHSGRRPEGWGGPPRCEVWAFVMDNSPRYNRRWGRHLPTVWLWRCPRGDRHRLHSRAERFARLLGSDAEAVYFGRILGRANWPRALTQLAAALSLTPPPRRFLTDTQQLGPAGGSGHP